jgi:nitrogen fixation/metabolism regulation signal transduction histidine kinase
MTAREQPKAPSVVVGDAELVDAFGDAVAELSDLSALKGQVVVRGPNADTTMRTRAALLARLSVQRAEADSAYVRGVEDAARWVATHLAERCHVWDATASRIASEIRTVLLIAKKDRDL